MKMENNKIDKLFRDKLKEVKVSPPTDTWEAIAEKLPKKKKNKVIFLWWAAAAVVLALITSGVFYWSFADKESQTIQCVEKTKEDLDKSKKDEQKSILATENKQEVDENRKATSEKTGVNKIQNINDNSSYSNNKAIAQKSISDDIIDSQETKKEKSSIDIVNAQHIAENKKKIDSKEQKEKNALHSMQDRTQNEATHKSGQITQSEQIATNEKVVDTQQEVKSLVDSNTLVASEEEINNSDKKQQGRWSVGPQVAPVYYNSISGGSSLDSQFNDSSKEGGINMSMGLQVAYQVNDNWQLRSGINRVNVGYATNNVQVGYSDPILAMANINYNNVPDGEVVITVFSDDNLSEINASNHGNRVELVYMGGNTQLKQSLTYIEVPVEIERKIIQSDFEWSIIGGVSSLFLTDNDVYVTNNDYRSNIGSASNLEKTSFTTNIGMGFGYNFTKNIHFQLEPMFKYQLNAYTNSVDFKPYIFGLYTGVKWRLD